MKRLTLLAVVVIAGLSACAAPSVQPTQKNWTVNPCLHEGKCDNRPYPVNIAQPWRQVDEGLGAGDAGSM